MTADWAELPHGCSRRSPNRIINEVRGVNRVVYDVTASRRRRSSGNDSASSGSIGSYRKFLLSQFLHKERLSRLSASIGLYAFRL